MAIVQERQPFSLIVLDNNREGFPLSPWKAKREPLKRFIPFIGFLVPLYGGTSPKDGYFNGPGQ